MLLHEHRSDGALSHAADVFAEARDYMWGQAIAVACFNVDPDQRPDFKEICDQLSVLRADAEAVEPEGTSYPMHIL